MNKIPARGQGGKFLPRDRKVAPSTIPETPAPAPVAEPTIAPQPAIVETPPVTPPPIEGINQDGSPKKRRGRPPGRRNNPELGGHEPGAAHISPQQGDPDAIYKGTATMFVGLGIGIAVGVFGDEWKPTSEQEQAGLEIATAAYLKSKGIADISPGWMLLGAIAAYSMPRIQQPKTKEKIDKVLIKLFVKKPQGESMPQPDAPNPIHGIDLPAPSIQ